MGFSHFHTPTFSPHFFYFYFQPMLFEVENAQLEAFPSNWPHQKDNLRMHSFTAVFSFTTLFGSQIVLPSREILRQCDPERVFKTGVEAEGVLRTY